MPKTRLVCVERPGFRYCPHCRIWIQYPCVVPKTHMGACGGRLQKDGPFLTNDELVEVFGI